MARGRDIQTILAGLYPRAYPEDLPVSTKIVVQVAEDARVQVETTRHDRGQRLVVMFHGFTGNANSPVLLRALTAAYGRGYSVARVNMRNAGGTHALCKGLFNLLQWNDVGRVLEQLQLRLAPRHMFAIGFSVGGNLLLNQIAREPACGGFLRAMAAINPPIDIPMSASALSQPRNRIYMRTFARSLAATVRRKRDLGELYADPDQPFVNTVREFDSRFVLPEIGFSSLEEYYAAASSVHELHRIRIPTLLVASKDDPIVPISMFETIRRRPPNLQFAISDCGGHIGYFYRRGRQWRFWAADVALDFFEST
jgi:predicted alpha/beta-fold hydrolase